MVFNFLKSLTEWNYNFNTQKHITVSFFRNRVPAQFWKLWRTVYCKCDIER